MDNDIYDKIADYNDWVHLERPPGGAVEIEKQKQKQIKLLIEVLKEIFSKAMDYLAIMECMKKYPLRNICKSRRQDESK